MFLHHATNAMVLIKNTQRSYETYIFLARQKTNSGFQYLRKGKAIPLQALTGPECSRKLRFPDFVTKAQDGGKVVSLMHRPPLPPGNTPGTHFC